MLKLLRPLLTFISKNTTPDNYEAAFAGWSSSKGVSAEAAWSIPGVTSKEQKVIKGSVQSQIEDFSQWEMQR